MAQNRDLKKIIIEISKELQLSHVGSCLSVLPILEEIYSNKKSEDKVVLDNAHAHLAHLMVLPGEPKELIEKYGIHCDRQAGCDATGGSLGHGIGISIGMALANPDITVHCIVSDGSMMEGSNWEALRLINDLNVHNINIYCNFNGYTAVAERDIARLSRQMLEFTDQFKVYSTNNGLPELEGINGHYDKI